MVLYWNANALFSSEVFRDEVREGCLQEGIGSGCVLVRFGVAFLGALECTRIVLGFIPLSFNLCGPFQSHIWLRLDQTRHAVYRSVCSL